MLEPLFWQFSEPSPNHMKTTHLNNLLTCSKNSTGSWYQSLDHYHSTHNTKVAFAIYYSQQASKRKNTNFPNNSFIDPEITTVLKRKLWAHLLKTSNPPSLLNTPIRDTSSSTTSPPYLPFHFVSAICLRPPILHKTTLALSATNQRKTSIISPTPALAYTASALTGCVSKCLLTLSAGSIFTTCFHTVTLKQTSKRTTREYTASHCASQKILCESLAMCWLFHCLSERRVRRTYVWNMYLRGTFAILARKLRTWKLENKSPVDIMWKKNLRQTLRGSCSVYVKNIKWQEDGTAYHSVTLVFEYIFCLTCCCIQTCKQGGTYNYPHPLNPWFFISLPTPFKSRTSPALSLFYLSPSLTAFLAAPLVSLILQSRK